jgi:hypothetical protein
MPKGGPDIVRPSAEDRCAECGDLVGDEWESYRQDLVDPETVIRHFGGIVVAKRGRSKVMEAASSDEPETGGAKADVPKRSMREFRYPEDLNVFFHRTCAPQLELPEKLREEIASILADLLVAEIRRNPPKAD